jgi:hypothetical protein
VFKARPIPEFLCCMSQCTSPFLSIWARIFLCHL